MRLRNLFEAFGEEVAIIFGRFNPPHKGHRAAWELASKSPVWYVGTNESTVGPKDPLPYDVKVEAMKTVWPEVQGHIVPETSWLTLASKVYEKNPNATLLCLTDEDWVTKTIVQYNGKEGAHGFYNFKKIEQKPTPRLSSATALRDAVSKGDRDAFTQAAGVDADTPVAGKPFFDLVAEYLLPYSNAPKKVVKKKVAAPVEGVAEGSEGFSIEDMVMDQYRNGNEVWEIASNMGMSEDEVQDIINDGEQGVAEDGSNAMSDTAKRLANKDDGKVAKLRAAGDKRREEELKGRNIAKRNEDAAGVGIITKQNTTKDVNKGTLRKMMKAYHLVDDLEETYNGDEFFETYGVMWYNEDQLDEAKYQGRSVPLGKPMRGDVKKFKVYVKDPSTGNVKKVNFGDPNMTIKKSNPARRRSFRARHNCDNPGPRTKARYWSCRKW